MIFTDSIGSVVEHYDFGVYGYAATTLAAPFFSFLVADREPAGPYYGSFMPT